MKTASAQKSSPAAPVTEIKQGIMPQIPAGYKMTELGVIPNSWQTEDLGSIGQVIRGASPRPKGDPRYYGGNVPRLMVEDVTRDGKFVTPQVDFLTVEGAKKSRPCPAGTLTIVCSGTVGIPAFLSIDACIHDGFLALIDIKKKVYPDYLYHYLVTQKQNFDKSATHGGVFTNLTTTSLGDFKVILPDTTEEQKAIAGALSDIDDLIAAQEELIAKKRDIKQATMQQLLTGRTRLPGFKSKWKKISMLTDATLKARIGWQGLTTEEYLKTGDYMLVTGTDFDGGKINWSSCWFVDKHRYVQDTNIQLKPGDVLLTKDGTIGKAGYIDTLPTPATLNSGVFVIRPIANAFNPQFFFYILTSRVFDDFLNRLQAGSTIVHLYQKDFVTFHFSGPSEIEEQEAIASVLSDMDAEVSALETELEKTRAIKQGMMQELLTGRIRLI